MVQVSRREKESTASLLRRFTRKAQQAGLVLEARKVRYHKRSLSPFKKRKSAIRRLRIRALRQKLIKAGTIQENQDIPQQLKKKVTK